MYTKTFQNSMHQILQVRIDKDKLDKLDDYRQTVEKSITYIPSNDPIN